MSNIATGIALSGPLEISTKGQEAQLGAAKFGAEKRIEEQRRKEKEKAERDKEIKKNTSFDKQYDNALIQNMHEEDAAASIGDIVAGLSGDDANARVEAEKSLSSFKRKMKEREIMDKQMSEMLDAAKKADIDIDDPHTIGGFTYANALQALEDKRNWNPERLQEIGDKFNSSFFNLSIDENTGQPIIDFNPLGAASLNYDEEIFKGITPEEFAVEGRPKKYSLGNTEKEVADLFPTPDAVMRSTISVAQDPRTKETAFRRAYREAKAKNPDLSQAKFMEEGERLHQERIRAGERGLAQTFREEMINTQLEKAAEEALKRAGAQREISTKTPAPKEAKPSAAQKNADRWASAGSYADDGKTWVVSLNLPTGRTYGNAKIPKGATYTNDKGEEQKVPADVTLEATPIGFEWRGPSDSYFLVQSKLDPKGQSIGGIDQMYEYRIPVSRVNADNFGTLMGTNREGAMKKLLEGSQDGPVNDIKKWAEQMGVDPSGLPGSGQGAAPARPAQGNQEQTASPKTITVILDGKIGSIPSDQWDAFKKKYPNAKKQ